MVLADALTRVRHLINQTDNTNTLYDDTNFIGYALNQGRRMFAAILPEEMLPKLRKSASLVVASNVGAYPTDFLRKLKFPYVVIDGTIAAPRVTDGWRLRFLASSDLTDDEYFYERSDGVFTLGTTTTIVYEYIKTPVDLSASDNVELPADIDDLVIDFAFQKCMGTTRGDKELAAMLWRETKDKMGAKAS